VSIDDRVIKESGKVMSHDASHRYEWKTMPWRKLEVRVFKLQRRIYQATNRGETQKARSLQKLLAASWSAKSLAVRRVTQENKGKKTAGVDGVKSLTPPQRLKLISAMDLHAPVKPVRRIWIPKPGKLAERPLGIPMGHAYCISLQRRLGIAVVAPTSMNALDQLTQYNELGEADQVSSGKKQVGKC
jgi:hypothetical protein